MLGDHTTEPYPAEVIELPRTSCLRQPGSSGGLYRPRESSPSIRQIRRVKFTFTPPNPTASEMVIERQEIKREQEELARDREHFERERDAGPLPPGAGPPPLYNPIWLDQQRERESEHA